MRQSNGSGIANAPSIGTTDGGSAEPYGVETEPGRDCESGTAFAASATSAAHSAVMASPARGVGTFGDGSI